MRRARRRRRRLPQIVVIAIAVSISAVLGTAISTWAVTREPPPYANPAQSERVVVRGAVFHIDLQVLESREEVAFYPKTGSHGLEISSPKGFMRALPNGACQTTKTVHTATADRFTVYLHHTDQACGPVDFDVPLNYPSTAIDLRSLRFPQVLFTPTDTKFADNRAGQVSGSGSWEFDAVGSDVLSEGALKSAGVQLDPDACSTSQTDYWKCSPTYGTWANTQYEGDLTLLYPSAFADYETNNGQAARDIDLSLVAIFSGALVAGIFFIMQWLSDIGKR